MSTDHRLVTYLLTQEQLAAVGSVVIESTNCEAFVELLIWDLCRLHPEQGKFLTHPLQMSSRLDLLSNLGKPLLRSQKKKDQLTDLISRLKEVANERNTIVHGVWSTDKISIFTVLMDGPGKHPPAVATKRRLNSEPLKMSAAKIRDVALKQAEVYRELVRFCVSWTHRASLTKPLAAPAPPKRTPARKKPKLPAKRPPP